MDMEVDALKMPTCSAQNITSNFLNTQHYLTTNSYEFVRVIKRWLSV